MNPIRRDNAGPFYMPRLPYKIGFRWQEEMRLRDGWNDVGTSHLPSWAARAVGPYGGVVGTWDILRHRLTFRGIPIGRWKEGQATYCGGNK